MDLSSLLQSLTDSPEFNNYTLASTLVEELLRSEVSEKDIKDLATSTLNPEEKRALISKVLDHSQLLLGINNITDRISTKVSIKLYDKVGSKVEKLIPAAPTHFGKVDDFI